MSNTKTVFLSILLTAAIVGGGVYFWQNMDKKGILRELPPAQLEQKNTPTPATNNESNTPAPNSFVSYVPYERQNFVSQAYGYQLINMDFNDMALVRINRKDGGAGKFEKTEVLFSSFKTAYPQFKPELLHYVNNFGDKIVFNTFTPETESPMNSFLLFDADKKTLEPMKLNQAYQAGFGNLIEFNGVDFINAQLSYDGSEAEKLVVLNIQNDTSKELVTLAKNETFDGGGGGLGASVNIEWLSDKHIRYAVFDRAKLAKLSLPDESYKALIGYRELQF